MKHQGVLSWYAFLRSPGRFVQLVVVDIGPFALRVLRSGVLQVDGYLERRQQGVFRLFDDAAVVLLLNGRAGKTEETIVAATWRVVPQTDGKSRISRFLKIIRTGVVYFFVVKGEIDAIGKIAAEANLEIGVILGRSLRKKGMRVGLGNLVIMKLGRIQFINIKLMQSHIEAPAKRRLINQLAVGRA